MNTLVKIDAIYGISPELSINYIINLHYLGLLKVSGVDAKKLLQGQLTCNIEQVSETLSQLGAHCNYQGRVISFFRIFRKLNDYFLQMPRVLIPVAHKALQKYAVFYKVEIIDVSENLAAFGFQGNILQSVVPNPPKNKNEVLNNADYIIINQHPRFQIIGDPSKLSQLFLDCGMNGISDDYWHSLDICSLIPTLYPETSELFLPHELNLPELNAVHFNKGCYTGQEVIARMHYRGKLKKKMYCTQAEYKKPPPRGADIELNSELVTVVDYVNLKDNHYVFLILGSL